MNNFHIHCHFPTTIWYYQNTDRASAGLKSIFQSFQKTRLVKHWNRLFYITSFGHSDNYVCKYHSQRGDILDLPVQSWRSRTLYCLNTGPNMVWTTTLGPGWDINEDSSWSCLVKRSTPKYRCWPVAAEVLIRITWQGRPWRINRSPVRMWWHGIVTVLWV